MTKTHMSLGTLQGAAASATLVAGLPSASILPVGDWARISTQARHYFLTYVTTTDCHQNPVHWTKHPVGQLK